MAGTHDFTVPDRDRAERLAESLAEYGFADVKARPADHGEWVVIALDEGPYAVDVVGQRTFEAVGRAAAAIAREHGGHACGGSRFDVSAVRGLRAAGAPVVSANPGARPPLPTVEVVVPPPRVALALSPDVVLDVPVDLSGLDDVPWAGLTHACGSADDVPGLLRELATSSDDWDEVLDELFGDDLLHQGTCYEATAPALPFLTRMIVSGTLPARRRLDLLVWLLVAAGRWADCLVGRAEVALVRGHPPVAADWTEDVRRTVGEQVPALLSRWDVEPPAVRFVLACLAALHPGHGRQVAARVADLAHDYPWTQPGQYLLLAAALLHGRDDEADALAADVVAWEDDHDPAWLDAPGVPAAVRAGHVLAEGAPFVVNFTV